MDKAQRRQELQNQAWIGDAVLELYARAKILREHGALDDALAQTLCSNQFLTAFGEPTAVEAQIGRVYLESGLDAAFAWIESNILPLYNRQQEKKRKRA